MEGKENRKITIFESTLNRLEFIVHRNDDLSNRAREKSVKISNSISEIDITENPKRDDSVNGLMNSLMDKLDYSQLVLEQVVSDLENAIP